MHRSRNIQTHSQRKKQPIERNSEITKMQEQAKRGHQNSFYYYIFYVQRGKENMMMRGT